MRTFATSFDLMVRSVHCGQSDGGYDVSRSILPADVTGPLSLNLPPHSGPHNRYYDVVAVQTDNVGHISAGSLRTEDLFRNRKASWHFEKTWLGV